MDRFTVRQTDRFTVRQTGRFTVRQMDRFTVRQTDRFIVRQTDRFTVRQTDRNLRTGQLTVLSSFRTLVWKRKHVVVINSYKLFMR